MVEECTNTTWPEFLTDIGSSWNYITGQNCMENWNAWNLSLSIWARDTARQNQQCVIVGFVVEFFCSLNLYLIMCCPSVLSACSTLCRPITSYRMYAIDYSNFITLNSIILCIILPRCFGARPCLLLRLRFTVSAVEDDRWWRMTYRADGDVTNVASTWRTANERTSWICYIKHSATTKREYSVDLSRM